MAITHVSGHIVKYAIKGTGDVVINIGPTFVPTVGNWIIMAYAGNAAPSSVTFNPQGFAAGGGVAMTQDVAVDNSGNVFAAIYSVQVPSTCNSSCDILIGGSDLPCVGVWEFTGIDPTTPVVDFGSATANSTTSIDTSNVDVPAGYLIMGCCGWETPSTDSLNILVVPTGTSPMQVQQQDGTTGNGAASNITVIGGLVIPAATWTAMPVRGIESTNSRDAAIVCAVYQPGSSTQALTASLITSTSAIYSPTVIPDQFLTPSLITSTSAIYGATVSPDQLLTTSLLDGGAAIYDATLSTVNDLTATLVDGGSAIYGPSLSVFLTPTLIDAGSAIYDATVTQPVASQDLTASLLDGGSAIYGPTLSTINDLAPTLITSTSSIYDATVAPAPYPLTATLITSTSSIYDPTIDAVNDVTATLIVSTSAIYAPTVIPDQLLAPTLLDGAAAIYDPVLAPAPWPITTDLITSTSAVYDATVVPGPLSLTTALLDGVAAIYSPTVEPAPWPIDATLITSTSAAYGPTVSPYNVLAPTLLDGGSATYGPQLDLVLTVDLITSSSAIYDATMVASGAPQTVTTALLDGGAAIYGPTVEPDQFLTVAFIDAGAAIYGPALSLYLLPTLLDGGAALYAPSLSVFLEPTLITSTATPYDPTVSHASGAAQALTVAFVDAGPAIYDPTVSPYSTLAPDLLDAGALIWSPTITNTLVYLTGVTRDRNGKPLGGCVVHVFRTSDDVEVAQGTSNGVGAFSLAVAAGVEHYIVAYKAGSPDVAGTTKNTLVGS